MEMNSAEILRNAAYEEGYKAGVDCGKLCASQQILDDLETFLKQKREELKQNRDLYPEVDFPESNIYWQGRSLTCLELLQYITKLKNKYEVN